MAGYIFLIAPMLAEKHIAAHLSGLGFHDIHISGIHVTPTQTTATDIALDPDGIDHVASITLSRGWLNIMGGPVDVMIRAPDLYRTIDHVNDFLPALDLIAPSTLGALPQGGRINVQNARLNLDTPLGLLQYALDIIIEPSRDGRRLVTATLKSNQPAMALTSNWRGWIEPAGTLLIDAHIPELKLRLGALRLTRGNGWLSLSNIGASPSLKGQVESGGAVLGALPLQQFSLTIDARRDDFTILARANATGAPDTFIAADILLGGGDKELALHLTAHDLPNFLTYLDTALDRPADPLQQAFGKAARLALRVDYRMDKRFPGGPYPFDLLGKVDGTEFAGGTFLIYPGTFDMRGSVKAAPAYLPGIRRYFKIPERMISGDYIRLDASLAPALSSGISAGIENGAGEGP